MKPRTYIKKVNSSVKKGSHNRKIKVIRQNTTPSHGGYTGIALTYSWKTHDEIRIPKGLPKTKKAANKFGKTKRGRVIKKTYGLKRIPTEDEVLRHELWHVVKPHAKESTIKRYTRKTLPNRLPERRRKGFDKRR